MNPNRSTWPIEGQPKELFLTEGFRRDNLYPRHQIYRDRSINLISLSQSAYVDKVLK